MPALFTGLKMMPSNALSLSCTVSFLLPQVTLNSRQIHSVRFLSPLFCQIHLGKGHRSLRVTKFDVVSWLLLPAFQVPWALAPHPPPGFCPLIHYPLLTCCLSPEGPGLCGLLFCLHLLPQGIIDPNTVCTVANTSPDSGPDPTTW